MEPEEDTVPHGTCFLEIHLGADEELRVFATDLPQWYYRIAVSAERAASNCFTGALCGDDYRDTAAVQALMTTEGKADDAEVGDVCFALGTLAMGDLNATTYAQCGHVQILRESGAMPAESMLTYRGVPPAGKIYEGVIIDDHVVAAAVPRRSWKQSPAGRRTRELHEAGRHAYAAIGVPDVADKRQDGLRTAIAWGCELQGTVSSILTHTESHYTFPSLTHTEPTHLFTNRKCCEHTFRWELILNDPLARLRGKSLVVSMFRKVSIKLDN